MCAEHGPQFSSGVIRIASGEKKSCSCRGSGTGSSSNLRSSNVLGRFSSVRQKILYLSRVFSIRGNRSAILWMLSPLPSRFIFGYFLTSLPRRIKLWIWVLLYFRFRVFTAYSSILKPHFLFFSFKLNSLIFSSPNPKPIWPLKYFVSKVFNACSIFKQLFEVSNYPSSFDISISSSDKWQGSPSSSPSDK